jgi:hypothetical protein
MKPHLCNEETHFVGCDSFRETCLYRHPGSDLLDPFLYELLILSMLRLLEKKILLCYSNGIFLIGIFGGGVQLGPLGTTTTNRPIVPASGDYDDGEIGGMMTGKGNRSTRRKPAPVPLCPPQTPHSART